MNNVQKVIESTSPALDTIPCYALPSFVHASLFSGIGGFDLAAQWMGWENEFHCEWNPFGQKLLKHYWPHATSYTDITKTDFYIHRGTIDVLSGGFPCQPYSVAGKRKGKEDERHLWPEMLRAIREIQPSWVVGENVGGLINWNGGMVFDEVQTDLEAQGYEVWPYVLPACAVNAPHRRDRVWFIAYSASNGHELRGSGKDRCEKEKSQSIGNQRERVWDDSRGTCEQRIITDTESERGYRLPIRKEKTLPEYGIISGYGNVADTKCPGQQKRNIATEPNRQRYGAGLSIKNWANFPTQSPLCGGDDGISRELDGITFSKWRNESIKAYGNAIVPQVAYQIFQSIGNYEGF